jgi:predicted acyltransferase
MKKSQRYLALDVLRGITISGMILVNTPGSWSHVYAPLRHAAWHGCTPTDLVFPFFLFVMGVSMFFSFSKYGSELNKDSLIKIGKRTVLIFLIGLFLNSFPQWKTDFSSLRIMGVMQRIAIVYGISSLIVLSFRFKAIQLIGGGILLAYWGILYFFGGQDPFSLEQNVVINLDKWLFGDKHMYHGFGIAFDPEGLLSSLPAIVTTLIGYLVGRSIMMVEKVKLPFHLLFVGGVMTIVGWLWSYMLPLNKPLWTSSYVIYTAGLAIILLAILIWIIDIKGYKTWTSFFVVFGMNPLFIFALSGIWVKCLYYLVRIQSKEGVLNGYKALYEGVFVPLAGELNGSLLFAITHIIFFWFIGWVLYKRKIFIKV